LFLLRGVSSASRFPLLGGYIFGYLLIVFSIAYELATHNERRRIFACETSGKFWVGVSQVKLKFHGYSRAVEHRSHFARLTMAAQIVAMLCMLM